MKKTAETYETKKKITSKQVVAVIGIVLLVLMYIVTLITAIVDSSASQRLFWACLYATMAIPILIWVYTWMYGKLTRKHTFADFDLFPGDAGRAAEGNVNSGSAEESASGPDSAAESDVNSNSAAESASGSGPTQNHP